MHRLDIRVIKKEGWLETGLCAPLPLLKGNRELIAIAYEMKEDFIIVESQRYSMVSFTQAIKLTRTPCHYGGERYWFRCPTCNKRVAILYLNINFFKCRKCSNLTYPCQKESEVSRLFRKARRLRKKLKAHPYWEIPVRVKPKGMHNKTFNRLRRESLKTENQMWRKFGADTLLINERLSAIKKKIL